MADDKPSYSRDEEEGDVEDEEVDDTVRNVHRFSWILLIFCIPLVYADFGFIGI
jgi:hypothetical protein